MTIKELFAYTEEQYPSQYPVDIKLQWVNQLEKEIADFLEMFGEVEFQPHTDISEDPLIDEPDIYALYIGARTDFCNAEYGRYNNKVVQFNTFFDEWKARYMRHNKATLGTRYIKI